MRVPFERLLQHRIGAVFVAAREHDFGERDARFEMAGLKLYRAAEILDGAGLVAGRRPRGAAQSMALREIGA